MAITMSLHSNHAFRYLQCTMFILYAPLGWDRIKVSENLGVTMVAPVASVITSLIQL